MSRHIRFRNVPFIRSFVHIYDRLVLFSETRNGPELDVSASELGPDQHLNERRG